MNRTQHAVKGARRWTGGPRGPRRPKQAPRRLRTLGHNARLDVRTHVNCTCFAPWKRRGACKLPRHAVFREFLLDMIGINLLKTQPRTSCLQAMPLSVEALLPPHDQVSDLGQASSIRTSLVRTRCNHLIMRARFHHDCNNCGW